MICSAARFSAVERMKMDSFCSGGFEVHSSAMSDCLLSALETAGRSGNDIHCVSVCDGALSHVDDGTGPFICHSTAKIGQAARKEIHFSVFSNFNWECHGRITAHDDWESLKAYLRQPLF
jgi:hypothetical protein